MVIVVVLILAILGVLIWFYRSGYFAPIYNAPSASGSPSYVVPTVQGSPTATPKATKTPSPTPTPKPVSKTVTVGSNAALDGFESSNGGGNTTVDIRAGRNSNLITRGFVSFAVPSELSGKTVDKAVMRLYQGQVIGNPYTVGGSLKVDHLDYGSTLENADYSDPSLSASFTTLTTTAAVEWKDVDVKDQLIDDMANGRAYSQYRLHFAIESIGGDVTGDFAYFESQDNSMGTGNRPQLVITYH